MIGRDVAQESGGTHIELENRNSEVVGENVIGMKKEEKMDFSVPSKEEEPRAREDDTKTYLSEFLTTAPASSFVDGEKKNNDNGNVLLNIGTTSIGGGGNKSVICFDANTTIIEFAASTMGDVYVLSLTCKKWNSIINKIPNTANPIWCKIARRFYGQKVFRSLESIDSGCKHDSNTEWRMLLYIESVAKLSIFRGEVGQILKLLVWVFRSDNIIPYKLITWKESEHNGVRKRVKTTGYAEDYWQSLGVINDNTRKQGIDRFDVDFSEESCHENLKDKCVFVHYLDHRYIIANFVSECRIIHQWFHMFGFCQGEYWIYPPKAVKEEPSKGYEGYFKVVI